MQQGGVQNASLFFKVSGEAMKDKKAALRRELTALERTLSAEEKRASDRSIIENVLHTAAYQAARTVFCFVGRSDEIDTRPLLDRVLRDEKRLCVPQCVGRGQMVCREITALAELACGAYGIEEPSADAPLVTPEEIDLSLIPCVGAAQDGRRLGRGGGYYDRFLARYGGAAILLCRGAFLREDIPMDGYDIPVPILVTESGIRQNNSLPQHRAAH